MREIRFRAWDGTQMNYGETSCWIRIDGHVQWNGFPKSLDEIKLMQYTGLKDACEDELYEGDIVKTIQDVSLTKGETIEEGFKLRVIWNEYTAAMGLYPLDEENVSDIDYDLYLWDEDSTTYLQIVGNIYENKDLLYE